jgi:hypothetical protein
MANKPIFDIVNHHKSLTSRIGTLVEIQLLVALTFKNLESLEQLELIGVD